MAAVVVVVEAVLYTLDILLVVIVVPMLVAVAELGCVVKVQAERAVREDKVVVAEAGVQQEEHLLLALKVFPVFMAEGVGQYMLTVGIRALFALFGREILVNSPQLV
jgi:hypothetical protein